MAVKLTPGILPWYRVPGSTSHISLAVTGGHPSSELGPMIKNTDWIPTGDPLIHTTHDGLFTRVICVGEDVGTAAAVQLDHKRKIHDTYYTQLIMTDQQLGLEEPCETDRPQDEVAHTTRHMLVQISEKGNTG